MQTTVSRELWLENAMAQYETPVLRLCCALLGDAAPASVRLSVPANRKENPS